MKNLINHIIKNKISCYFISPHQDDAIYSAGGLIALLSGKTNVTIVNVFNGKGNYPYTLSAKTFVKISRCNDVNELSEQRSREDRKVAKRLGIKIINLNYCDALWRKKVVNNQLLLKIGKLIPELLHIYPIYLLNIKNGDISSLDNILIKNITNDMKKLISVKSFVFYPAAIGGHIDHKIVNNISKRIFINSIMWFDYPYSIKLKPNLIDSKFKNNSIFEFNDNQNERCILSKMYKSQEKSLFLNEISRTTSEKYIVSKQLMNIIKN